MKRSGFKNKPRKPLKRSVFKPKEVTYCGGLGDNLTDVVYYNAPNKPKMGLKRGQKLRVVGISDNSVLKQEIQALLREAVIKRDGGCILRHYPEAGACGGRRKDGELVLQAEHLITRKNNATFSDLRNLICICRHHHINWKPQHSHTYWQIIEKHLGKQLWNWYLIMKEDRSIYKTDWKLAKLVLENEIKQLSTEVK